MTGDEVGKYEKVMVTRVEQTDTRTDSGQGCRSRHRGLHQMVHRCVHSLTTPRQGCSCSCILVKEVSNACYCHFKMITFILCSAFKVKQSKILFDDHANFLLIKFFFNARALKVSENQSIRLSRNDRSQNKNGCVSKKSQHKQFLSFLAGIIPVEILKTRRDCKMGEVVASNLEFDTSNGISNGNPKFFAPFISQIKTFVLNHH